MVFVQTGVSELITDLSESISFWSESLSATISRVFVKSEYYNFIQLKLLFGIIEVSCCKLLYKALIDHFCKS